MRIGQGFDVHKFGGVGPVVLAGVTIPYEKGLVAHSDGDVVLHAIIDALLGALALGDIGTLFPDTDVAFKDVNSRHLLCNAYQHILCQGYQLSNLDATIIAEKPKMMPHISLMRRNIAEDLHVSVNKISIKATTTEGLGFTGRSEGIACSVNLLLEKKQSVSA